MFLEIAHPKLTQRCPACAEVPELGTALGCCACTPCPLPEAAFEAALPVWPAPFRSELVAGFGTVVPAGAALLLSC